MRTIVGEIERSASKNWANLKSHSTTLAKGILSYKKFKSLKKVDESRKDVKQIHKQTNF